MFGTFPVTNEVANDSSVSKETMAETPQEAVETVDSSADQQSSESREPDSDAAEDTAAEATQEDTSESEKTAKPRRGFERRIERMNQKLAQREQELDYWRGLALKSNLPETPQSAPVPTGRPQFADYNDIESYTEALTDWKFNQQMAEFRAQTNLQSVTQTYEQRLADFRQKQPDFDQVMNDFIADYGDEQVPEIVEVALESEQGPALAYYLAQNTDEVERIKSLPPRRRLLELGKIEDRLAKPAARPVEPQKISRAAPPVKPVRGSSPAEVTDLRDPSLSYSEWVKRREAQLKKR